MRCNRRQKMGGWQQLLSLPVYVSHVPYPSLYPLHSPPTATTPPTTTHRTSSYLDHLISSHLISSHLISSHPPLLLSPSPCQAPLPPSACPSLTPSLVRSPLFSSRKAKCCCPPAHWAPPSCCCSQVGRRTGLPPAAAALRWVGALGSPQLLLLSGG